MNPGLHHEFGTDLRINRHGTRGPEFTRADVIALGDSCTALGPQREDQLYPFVLAASSGVDVVDAGTPGYNSLMGLYWLERSHLLDLHPKLVTIYYGWNDHWRAAGTEAMFRWFRHLAPHSRLATLLMSLQESIWEQEPPLDRLRWFPEVPLSQFKSNLEEIVKLARASGATVVLITGPAERRLVKAGEGWFIDRSVDEFEDHFRYSDAIREVARQTGAGLVDFAREYDRIKTDDSHAYMVDFVHLNAAGHRLLAFLLQPWVECAMRHTCATR
jgi:lysophospholipase L1-like esterase